MTIDRRYRLDALIGEGSMGWVYRGTLLTLSRRVAVKLMKPSSAARDLRDERFEREARAASRLNNPHTLSVIDFGRSPGGYLYFVSELLEGPTLSSLLSAHRDGLPFKRAISIFSQLLSAVDSAHKVGLIHRDLKPDNIMVPSLEVGGDLVKVLDFGIVKFADDDQWVETGRFCGTPRYTAPEQAVGRPAIRQTDLYACGLILFELLVGRAPFDTEDAREMLRLQVHAAPPVLRKAAPHKGFTAELEAVVSRSLVKDPAKRFGSAGEFRDALMACLESAPSCQSCYRPRAPGAAFCGSCHHFTLDRVHPAGGLGPPAAWPTPVSEIGLRPEGSRNARLTFEPASVPTIDGETGQGAALHETAQAPKDNEHAGQDLWPIPTPPEGSAVPHPRLVGRHDAIRTVVGLLTGEATILEISGALGIGKSAMLDEATLLAEHGGWRVLRAGGDPTLSRGPWYPVRALIRRAAGIDDDVISATLLEERARAADLSADDLWGLFDLFGIGLSGERPSLSVRLTEARAAAVRLLTAGATTLSPLLVLLDDVDAYDGPSLTFVRHLCDALDSGRLTDVKLIVTAESSVMSGDARHLRLGLGLLSPKEVIQLVSLELMDRSVPPSMASNIVAATVGLPLHVKQCTWAIVEGDPLPDRPFAELVRDRIARLPGSARHLLSGICVYGYTAPLAWACAVEPNASTRGADLHLLEQRDLVRLGAAGSISVSHSLIAQVVRHCTSEAIENTLHELACWYLRDDPRQVLARARHVFEGVLDETALNVVESAGDLARQWLDEDGAAVQYRRAWHVARWELMLPDEDERAPSIALKLGEALLTTGRGLAALPVLEEALSVSARPSSVRVGLLRAMARVALFRRRGPEAVEIMERAVGQAVAIDDVGLVIELYDELGEVLDRVGETERAVDELQGGILLATAGDGPNCERPPPGLWRLVVQLAELEAKVGDCEQAVAGASHGLQLAREAQSPFGRARAHLLMSRCFVHLRAPEDAEAHSHRALSVLQGVGDRRAAAEVLLNRADIEKPWHRKTQVARALDLSRQIGWAEGIRRAQAHLGTARSVTHGG